MRDPKKVVEEVEKNTGSSEGKKRKRFLKKKNKRHVDEEKDILNHSSVCMSEDNSELIVKAIAH